MARSFSSDTASVVATNGFEITRPSPSDVAATQAEPGDEQKGKTDPGQDIGKQCIGGALDAGLRLPRHSVRCRLLVDLGLEDQWHRADLTGCGNKDARQRSGAERCKDQMAECGHAG